MRSRIPPEEAAPAARAGGAALAAWLLLAAATAPAGQLERLSGVRLEADRFADGDSFLAAAGAKRLRLRLYYVDCPETGAGSRAEDPRLRDQMNYFGLASPDAAARFGLEAKAFTARALSAPFTVHTGYADAMGNSPEGRVFAFVTTAGGRDLAELLVENGLARIHGARRAAPDGSPESRVLARLRDLELVAALTRAGAWAASDPKRLAALREEERREKDAAAGKVPLIDVNRAARRELEAAGGIGRKLARRIVAGRPYRRLEDLMRVEGFTRDTLGRLRGRLTVGEEPSGSGPAGP